MEQRITRNDEEQAAFEALKEVCLIMPRASKSLDMAEGIERQLLARGYVIVRIDEINDLLRTASP